MILGAILAGGRSSRFGADKASALLDGRPLIDHVAQALAPKVATVILCGRECEDRVGIADRPGPGLGPLGGINAALHHAAANGFHRVLTAPCDTPMLDGDLLDALLASDEPVCLASLPVLGCWPSILAAELDAHLASTSDRSVRCWVRVSGTRMLDRRAPINVNRRADLKRIAAGG